MEKRNPAVRACDFCRLCVCHRRPCLHRVCAKVHSEVLCAALFYWDLFNKPANFGSGALGILEPERTTRALHGVVRNDEATPTLVSNEYMTASRQIAC